MFPSFDQRSLEKERLDTGEYTNEEYELWLREAPWINRRLGDASALRGALSRFRGSHISILDVGAGSGEMLKIAKEQMKGHTALLAGAELSERAAQEIASRRFGVSAVRCNALELPFGDDSFDVVMCSLVLHHLDDEDCVRLLDEMGRVARRLVVAIDLIRNAVPYFVYRTFAPLFLQPLTVDDGLLSILRSRRPDELFAIGTRTSLRNVKVEQSFPARVLLTGETSA